MLDPTTSPLAKRVPCHSPEAHAEAMHGETVLLQSRTEEYFSLNEVGARLWDLSDGQRNVADIFLVLRNEYAVDAGELYADMADLLTDLVANQLMTWAGD